MRIMNEVSYLSPHVDEINALTLDDPELFRYPIAYIIEVDWWAMTDREAAALRVYLQKGGFVIVDDFNRGAAARRLRRRAGRRFGGGYGTGWRSFEADDEARAAAGEVRRPRRVAPDLPLVLRSRSARHHPAGLHRRASRSSAGCSRTTIRASGCR